MADSADLIDHRLRVAADRLAGHPKRLFQVEVAITLCGGSARAAERRFGWGRDAVAIGLGGCRAGIRSVEGFPA